MLWAQDTSLLTGTSIKVEIKGRCTKETFGLFAQPKKFHSRTMLFFVKPAQENKYSKFRIFFTGQGGKVSLVKILFPQLREACFEATKI